jgi:hypothetical protein
LILCEDFHQGRPRYVERNKRSGAPFTSMITPAEIVYCQDIESWVFRHQDIRTSIAENDNDCGWLLRSPRTDSFDLIELADETDWNLWAGYIKSETRLSIECKDCEEGLRKSCNYHGECSDKRCICEDMFFGHHCEFLKPCEEMRCELKLFAFLFLS